MTRKRILLDYSKREHKTHWVLVWWRKGTKIILLASSDEITLWLLLKTILFVFQNFLNVNCLLIFYSVYCSKCFVNEYNGDFYCTRSLVILLLPEMCFWPAKSRKKLEFFELHSRLGPGAQMFFRHKRRRSSSLLFLFIVLMNIVDGLILEFSGWIMLLFVVMLSAWTKICRNWSIMFLLWRNEIFEN